MNIIRYLLFLYIFSLFNNSRLICFPWIILSEDFSRNRSPSSLIYVIRQILLLWDFFYWIIILWTRSWPTLKNLSDHVTSRKSALHCFRLSSFSSFSRLFSSPLPRCCYNQSSVAISHALFWEIQAHLVPHWWAPGWQHLNVVRHCLSLYAYPLKIRACEE